MERHNLRNTLFNQQKFQNIKGMSKLVRSTIVSVVNLLITLMLLGNQQEIVAFSWNS